MGTRPRHDGVAWPEARHLAHAAATPAPPVRLPLERAVGRRLVGDLRALTDLPVADLSAMDGWAVSGPPPWTVVAELLAGAPAGPRLRPGQCAAIATGGVVPAGAESVLPVEHGHVSGDQVDVGEEGPRQRRRHVRTAGEEARRGDVLLPAGALVTPPVVGLAAAAGHDDLEVAAAAEVDVLVLGDELTVQGLQAPGATRDALGPQLPAWLTGFGTAAPAVRHLPDRLDLLVDALATGRADLVVTTGGTSVGRRDHVRAAVAAVGGRVVVDGVRVKPGHPMMLATLPSGAVLVALPGNPFAACSGLLTLVRPYLAGRDGRPAEDDGLVLLCSDEPARPRDPHRLLPVTTRPDGAADVLPSCGSAMLRGLALADGLVVVPPTGASSGDEVPYLPLPWAGTSTGRSSCSVPGRPGGPVAGRVVAAHA